MTEKVLTKNFGKANEINVDDFLRGSLNQMFEGDNEVSTLTVTLDNAIGSGPAPELKFKIILESINGVETKFAKTLAKLENDNDE